MIIHTMRACFGRLQQEELVLQAGLNVIEAPNEGGKSTWSAFLRAMLYGINTKQRDKQGYIAEKNRYQPWSGAPMEGTMELTWQGRDITLRRSSRAGAPFGKLEAVWTGTEEPVPGLTGENCGETLVGAPREVFERSAFVGQGNTAIDGAPALEGRIAALASSGEEDVSYSQVERRLKDWRNRRQHNRTGLIPRLEGELAVLDDTLARQAKAHRLAEEARRELERLEEEIARLDRELAVHRGRQQAQRRQRYEAACAARAQAQALVDDLEAQRSRHGTPPDVETLRKAQEDLNYLNTVSANQKLAQRQAEEARQRAEQALAAARDPLFPGQTPDEAWRQANADAQAAGHTPRYGGRYAAGAALLAVGLAGLLSAVCGVLPAPLGGSAASILVSAGAAAALAASGLALLVTARLGARRAAGRRMERLDRYGAQTPEDILTRANAYRESCVVAAQTQQQREAVESALAELTGQQETLKAALLSLVHTFAPGVRDLFGISAAISRALSLEERLSHARVQLEGAAQLADSLPRPQPGEAEAPEGVEPRFDPAETAARRAAAEGEAARLRSAQALAQGELNTLGDPDRFRLRREEILEELERRRGEQEALTLALDGLAQANGELQARFSPELNRAAGEILSRLTGGKYGQVSLTRQFEALAAQAGGLTPRRALTLSQGTADQLYLAVRLAVCRQVLPDDDPVPLVLDDALANFDDSRMGMALDYLTQLGRERQILLFTCHGRERAYLAGRADAACIRLHS